MDIEAHGGIRAPNEVRMTDDGKGRKARVMSPNIEIGTIIGPAFRGLSPARVEPLGVIEIWWVQEMVVPRRYVRVVPLTE